MEAGGPVIVILQKSRKELMVSSIWKNHKRLDMEVTLQLSGEEWGGIFQTDRRVVQGRARWTFWITGA